MQKIVYVLIIIIITIAGLFLFYRFPDTDISLLGIGMHRFFLFHSVILPFIFYLFVHFIPTNTFSMSIIIALCGSFSLGVGFHLFFDIFQDKAIIFPFIGSLIKGTSLDDRLWTIINCILSIYIGYLTYKETMSYFERIK